jgi:hypothetical protein
MSKGSGIRAALLGAAVALAGSMLAPAAQADIVTYTIDDPNVALAGLTGPYASVEVDRTSSTSADITFTSLTNGGFLYLLGGAQAADVNVNATSFSVTNIACVAFGALCGPITNGGSNNVSEFGAFNLTLDSFDGFGRTSTEISFTLNNLSGTWLDAGSVLVQNVAGYIVAAHIFACEGGPGCDGAFATGFASVPGPIVGAGLPGVVAACGLLVGFARRRRRAIA